MPSEKPYSLTVGSDPEFFLVDSSGKYISSIDRFGGTKQNPRPMRLDGFYVQEDNVAVEFNIPPAASEKAFVDSIHTGLDEIKLMIESMDLDIALVPTARFADDQLEDMRAKNFGCDPDYNIWTRKRNPRPKAVDKTLRSCGGHIHVGITPLKDFDPIRAIKAMDLFLGVPSVVMDSDIERRSLYGKAGCFRPTPYGFEYRVLSNFWLKTKKLTQWAYRNTINAIHWSQDQSSETLDSMGDTIQEIINTSDIERAKAFIDERRIALCT